MKWFNAYQGYGFIITVYGGEDLFVHSAIVRAGYKSLAANGAETARAVRGAAPASGIGDAEGLPSARPQPWYSGL